MPPYHVATFYKFVALPDAVALRDPLMACCRQHDVMGTILLAQEGINGTVAGTEEGVEAVLAHLRSDPRLADLTHKASYAHEAPFYRLKVKVKPEIVTFRVAGTNPTEAVGTYVPPQDWNTLITDPDVMVIDTRNDFEVQMGTFQGAQNPHTASFNAFPTYVQQHLDPDQHPKVALFCTGGIRCEKATSYLLKQGFEAVYHLEGGILKYLEEVPEGDSLWQGECFVFDNRVALTHGLDVGHYTLCFACHHPLSPDDRAAPTYEEGVSCPHCYDHLTDAQRDAARERQRQVERARAHGTTHLGPPRNDA